MANDTSAALASSYDVNRQIALEMARRADAVNGAFEVLPSRMASVRDSLQAAQEAYRRSANEAEARAAAITEEANRYSTLQSIKNGEAEG